MTKILGVGKIGDSYVAYVLGPPKKPLARVVFDGKRVITTTQLLATSRKRALDSIKAVPAVLPKHALDKILAGAETCWK